MLRFGNKLLAWGSNILKMPDSLFTYIQSAFSNGFIRNMALSTIGGHDNALMGSYLLATTNNSITIADSQSLVAGKSKYTYNNRESQTGLGIYNNTKRIGVYVLNAYGVTRRLVLSDYIGGWISSTVTVKVKLKENK